MTDVVVVDDQRSFVESLQIAIDAQDDLRCVGAARTGHDGVRIARSELPDVVLMDYALPDLDGVAAAKQIIEHVADVRVIILTGRPDAAVLAGAATAGASAFLLKDAALDEILDAVRHPSSQRIQVDAEALGSILEGEPEAPAGALELTQRELEVLGLLAEGRQPKQIARLLGVTVPTCRGYVKTLLQKLGAHSALEAVVTAHRVGLVRLPDQT